MRTSDVLNHLFVGSFHCGFSVELFAEFVQMSCVNVTLNHKDFRQISEYFQYREQVVLNQSMGNIAFPNLQLPTESVLEHFQISLPIVMYPALILHLEDNDGFDPRPNPKFLVYFLILFAVGAFLLVIIVKNLHSKGDNQYFSRQKAQNANW